MEIGACIHSRLSDHIAEWVGTMEMINLEGMATIIDKGKVGDESASSLM